jgi:hypothetical protein
MIRPYYVLKSYDIYLSIYTNEWDYTNRIVYEIV